MFSRKNNKSKKRGHDSEQTNQVKRLNFSSIEIISLLFNLILVIVGIIQANDLRKSAERIQIENRPYLSVERIAIDSIISPGNIYWRYEVRNIGKGVVKQIARGTKIWFIANENEFLKDPYAKIGDWRMELLPKFIGSDKSNEGITNKLDGPENIAEMALNDLKNKKRNAYVAFSIIYQNMLNSNYLQYSCIARIDFISPNISFPTKDYVVFVEDNKNLNSEEFTKLLENAPGVNSIP